VRLGATVVPHSGVQHRHHLVLKSDDDLREVHAKAKRAEHEERALGQGGRVYSFASFHVHLRQPGRLEDFAYLSFGTHVC
jgi:hypothetical protein